MSERELPEGWVETTLGQVVTKPQYGYTTKASHHGSVKFLRTTDITKGKLAWEAVPFCHEEPDDIDKFRLHKGDVVVSRAGSVGFSYLIEDVVGDAVFASYLIRFRPVGDLGSSFVKRYLQSPFYWEQLKDRAVGNALQNVNAKKLTTLRIDIPPLAEQKLIADKLDELLAQVNNLKARLGAIPAILKRFRQSVLAAAVSGGLTDAWRSERDIDDEWAEFTVDSLAKKEKYSLCIGPFGSNLKVKDCQADGHPLVFVREIRSGAFGDGSTKYVDDEKFNQLAAHRVVSGDLLITKMGDPPGDVAFYPEGRPEAVITADCIKLSVDEEVADPHYVYYAMKAPRFRNRVVEASAGVAQKKVNLQKFKALPFELPSLCEQAEIVRRVDQLFAFADQVELQVASAQARVDKLTPSILAKAFRGELTAEWRDENPELISGEHSAEALLERIKAEKAKQTPTKTRRGGRKATVTS
ncbi:restriction endonuclease subunit S [Halomonas sp. SSL-5]|uniref:restriction endonuclease subunit S n=1 Tax=Halomonas sp. SSL-5 TaxID=3065855 RepID=UPI002739B1C5|nr:restriction endonuclease subunit S [Halomonas sp. SSL-5]MDY7116813.1 restriction endonuclease subunit S [Halomonas sp. SSL-5]